MMLYSKRTDLQLSSLITDYHCQMAFIKFFTKSIRYKQYLIVHVVMTTV